VRLNVSIAETKYLDMTNSCVTFIVKNAGLSTRGQHTDGKKLTAAAVTQESNILPNVVKEAEKIEESRMAVK
tara:strand:+ start:177 stop:392 length:216 start_codon:yes stop_codon:yes gene_type:complete